MDENFPSGFSVVLASCSLKLFAPFISSTLKLTKYANKLVLVLVLVPVLALLSFYTAALSLCAGPAESTCQRLPQ